MPIDRPGMKQVGAIIVLLLMTFCCRAAVAADAAQIKTDKEIYRAGEPVKVQFFNAPGIDSDWICIIAAGQPDGEAGEDYQYMPKGVSQGVLTFGSPPPGKYEARAYYHYKRNGYVVSARQGFTVESDLPAAPAAAPPAAAGKGRPTDTPAVKAAPADSFRVNISVFHFTPLNMDASPYSVTAANTIVNSLKKQPAFIMLDRRDLETFLFANDLQQSDRTENAIQIGTRLGLNFVVAGNVESRGTMIVTNCKVIGIEKRDVIFANRTVSMGESDLILKMTKLGDAIGEAMLKNRP